MQNRMKLANLLGLAAVAGSLALAAQPSTAQIFVTPTGSTAGGKPVDVTATFTESANQVMISLTNLLANPTSDIQTLNGVTFSLSSGQTVVGSFTEQAIQRTITGTGAGQYSDTGTPTTLIVAPDKWNYSAAGLGVQITSIGNTGGHGTLVGQPDGSNAYSAANGSMLAGSHQPFIAGTATFKLNMAGVTGDSKVTAVNFEFGTASGTVVGGGIPPSGNPVPEPGVMAMGLGTVVPVLGLIRRKRNA